MLTVIVPTYNAESYLSQAIGSLLNENKINLEILAINDGSTDNSLAVMQDFAARDSRVRVIDKANQGYGATCNLGIREAKGDWIAILEPDDWIEPGMYSDMLAFAKREFGDPNKLDIIETPYWIIRNPDTPQEVKLHCAYRGRIKPPRQPFTIHDAPHRWPIIRPFGRQSIVATSCCKTISGLRKSPVRAGPIIHSLSKRYARQRRSLTGPSRITATARKRPKRRLLWPSVTP